MESTFIESYDGIATPEYCDKMIAKYEELAQLSSPVYGEDQHNGVQQRKDQCLYFERLAEPLCHDTHQFLDTALRQYMEKYPSLKMCSFSSNHVKVQKTPPKGGFHVWHCEDGVGNTVNSRILAWTIYLNDMPEGEGETEFLEFGVKVAAKKGRISFFPSAFTHTHRGNPVYSHDKYIATGWYYFQ